MSLLKIHINEGKEWCGLWRWLYCFFHSPSPTHPKPFFTISRHSHYKFNQNTLMLKILHLLTFTFRISGYPSFTFRGLGIFLYRLTVHYSHDIQKILKTILVKKKEKLTWRVGCLSLFSCVQLFATPWTAAHQASLTFTISWSVLRLMSIESVTPSKHLVLCPLLLLPSVFPSIRVFSNEQLFASRGQSIGASVSVLLMNIQDWFPLELTCLISLQSKGLRVFSNTTVQKHQFFSTQPSLLSNSLHPYVTTGKTIALTRLTFVGKVMSLLFNLLLVYSFSSKEQVSFNFMAAVTICSDFGVQENKVCHCLHCFPIYLPWKDGTGCHDLSFLNVEF